MIDEIYYLNEDTDQMVDAENKTVQGKVSAASVIEREYIKRYLTNYVFQVDMQTDLYGTIQFPSLPTNFEMLMSKIPFPDKAQKNPNDALFVDPQKIDATIADDLSKQLFNSKTFKNLTGLKSTLTSEAWSRQFESLQNAVEELTIQRIFEDTPDGTGLEIDVPDTKGVNQQMTQMSQDVKNAITTYIRRAIEVIKPLLELTGGGATVKEVMKALNTANTTSMEDVKSWLDSVSKIKKDYNDALKNYDLSVLRNQSDSLRYGIKLINAISISEIPSGTSKIKYMKYVSDELTGASSKNDLDKLVSRCCRDYKNWIEFDKAFDKNNPKPIRLKKINFSTDESVSSNSKKHLNEMDDRPLTMKEETLKYKKMTSINYDKLYSNLVNYLSGEISNAIGERENWKCFKSIRDDMKKLKDRADAEIKKKIELVCKTGGQKSLIKWPMKAEGLLSMWERYSSELDIRINNRINQLTGVGGVETGSATMLEDFLRSTFPQIMASMICYRTLFEQLYLTYRNNFADTNSYTLEDVEVIKQEGNEEFGTRMKTLLITFKNRTV